jgi:hypothetical protein
MTIVDFDSFSNNQVLAPGTFDALGVRFNENLGVRANSAQGTLPGSAPNAALNVDSFGGDITGFFLGPVTSVDGPVKSRCCGVGLWR